MVVILWDLHVDERTLDGLSTDWPRIFCALFPYPFEFWVYPNPPPKPLCERHCLVAELAGFIDCSYVMRWNQMSCRRGSSSLIWKDFWLVSSYLNQSCHFYFLHHVTHTFSLLNEWSLIGEFSRIGKKFVSIGPKQKIGRTKGVNVMFFYGKSINTTIQERNFFMLKMNEVKNAPPHPTQNEGGEKTRSLQFVFT